MVGVIVIDPLFTPTQAVEVEVAVAVNAVPTPTVTGILGDVQPNAFRITTLCGPADTPVNVLLACDAPPSSA